MHQAFPGATAWQRRHDREEAFLRNADLLRAQRKSRALAAMGIVAAACVMVGATHVAARAGEPQALPPANVIDCLPSTGWHIDAVDEGVRA